MSKHWLPVMRLPGATAWRRACAATLTVALSVSCSGQVTAGRREVIEAGTAARVDLGDGMELVFKPGTVAEDAAVHVVRSKSTTPMPAWFASAGSVHQVGVDADLKQPLEIRWTPPGLPPFPGAIPVVMHHDPTNGWQPTAVGASGMPAVGVRWTFSPLVPGWLNPVKWAEHVSAGVRDLLGHRSDAPSCSVAPDWAGLTPPAQDVLLVCPQSNTHDGAPALEVQIRNNRGYMVEIGVPPGVAYAWVEGQIDPVRAFVRRVSGRDAVWLSPGQLMTVGFPRPKGQNEVKTIDGAIPTALLIAWVIGQAAGAEVAVFAAASALATCSGLDGLPLDLTPPKLREAVTVAQDCFRTVAKDPQAAATLATETIAALNGVSTSVAVSDRGFAAQVDKLAGALRTAALALTVVTVGSLVNDLVADLYMHAESGDIDSLDTLLVLRGEKIEAPSPRRLSFEEVAVRFIEDVMRGGQAVQWVDDPAVVDHAVKLLRDAEPTAYEIYVHPTYTTTDVPGRCNLEGDVTVVCYVAIDRPEWEATGTASTGTLVAVALWAMPPDAEYVDGEYLDSAGHPVDPVQPYVVDVDIVAD